MRLVPPVLALAATLLVAAFLVAGEIDTASGQQTVTVTMGPAAGPAGGGNQTGSASLTAMGNQTEVVISIDPSPDGASVEQPAHIHAGTCTNLGGVVHPLSNVVNGASTTMVDATLASLETGDFAINAHKSEQELGVYVSCGNIPEMAQVTPIPAPAATPSPASVPTTGGLPAGSGDGVSPWWCLRPYGRWRPGRQGSTRAINFLGRG